MRSEYYANLLLQRVGNNHSLAALFLQKILQDVPSQMAELEFALQNEALLSAMHITHKLQGSFSFYGFNDFKMLADDLQRYLSAGESVAAQRQLQRLAFKFKQLAKMHDVMMTYIMQ